MKSMICRFRGLLIILAAVFCFGSWTANAFARESFDPYRTAVSGTGTAGYRVSHGTGSPVYEVPLDAFFEIHSLCPNLVLRYHPNNGNSFTGYGWELALGKISRSCKLGVPQFDNTDIFILSLPGVGVVDELVETGSLRYATLYEKKNFYIEKASADKWVLKDGAGLTYEFAKPVYSSEHSEPMEWLLSSITEPHGSALSIEYEDGAGIAYPKKISYFCFEINFTYSSREDIVYSFAKGGKTKYDKLLTEIEGRSSGGFFRKYKLSYNTAGEAKRSFLNKVVEVGAGSAEITLAQAEYYHNNDSSINFGPEQDLPNKPKWSINSYYIRIGQMNNDHLPDIIYSQYSNDFDFILGSRDGGWSSEVHNPGKVDGPGYLTFSELAYRPGSILGDVNGDGFSDIIAGKYAAEWSYCLGSADGFSNYIKNTYTYSANMEFSNPDLLMCDINGDRKTDIVDIRDNGSELHIDYALSTGQGWGPKQDLRSNLSWHTGGGKFEPSSFYVRYFDINGDGLLDIVYLQREDSNREFAYVLGNSRTFDSEVFRYDIRHLSNEFSFTNKDLKITDINADGFADLIISKVAGNERYDYYYALGNGRTFLEPRKMPKQLRMCLSASQTFLVDCNNDAKTDILNVLLDRTEYKYHPLILEYFQSGLLKSVTDKWGKKTEFSQYLPSCQVSSSPVPFVFPVLTKMTESDGYSPVKTIDYSYTDLSYDNNYKELAGFAEVRETESPDNINRVYSYTQDRPHRGFLSAMDMNSSLLRQEYVYDNDTSIPYHNRLTYSRSSEDGKIIQTNLSYDGYDNITKEAVTTNAGESITTERWFSPNTGSWLVSLSYRERVQDESGSYKDTQYLYDGGNLSPSKGDVTQVKRHLADTGYITTTHSYDNWGNPVSTTDPLGWTTNRAYDSSFHFFPVSIINPLGHTESRDYYYSDHKAGQLKSITDPNGNVTSYDYDSFGRPSKVSSPYKDISYTHSIGGVGANYTEAYTKVDIGSSKSLYHKESLDGFSRAIEVKDEGVDGSMAVVQTNYDARGRPVNVSVPDFSAPAQWYYHSYDLLDRILSTTNPDGTIRRYSYSGWNVTVTDENNHAKTYSKDSRGRIKTVVDASGSSSYSYDIFDNLTNAVDPLGNSAVFSYDTLGRKRTAKDADRGAISYTYDNNDNLLKKQYSDNRAVTWTYDKLNRPLTGDYSDTSEIDIIYSYDEAFAVNGKGRRTSMSDFSGSVKWYYDGAGRRTRKERIVQGLSDVFNLAWSYDAIDRIKSITSPGGEVLTYIHNGPYVAGIGGYITDVDYNALGSMTAVNYNSGVNAGLTYWSTHHRLKNIAVSGLQNISYGYDQAGNITSLNDAVRGYAKTYAYDSLDRLLSGDSQTYTYDQTGNLKNKSGAVFSYDNQRPHLLIGEGINSYSYDSNGNLIAGAGRKIEYDAENRPVKISKDGAFTRFVYDGDGNRVKKTVEETGKAATVTVYIEDLYEKVFIE